MRFVFVAFLFIGAIYMANLFYGPVINNHLLEGKMIQLAKEKRIKADPYLLKDLMEFVNDKNIPLDQNQVTLYHSDPHSVVVSAHYEVYCKFWILEKDYIFDPTSAAPDHGVLPDFSAY